MQNVTFKITKLVAPANIWSGVSVNHTSDRHMASHALANGYNVQAFAGRQQRRVSMAKAMAN